MNTHEFRNVASGWQAVEYLGCDTDGAGKPITATADRIVKHWAASRVGAEKKLRGSA